MDQSELSISTRQPIRGQYLPALTRDGESGVLKKVRSHQTELLVHLVPDVKYSTLKHLVLFVSSVTLLPKLLLERE